MGSETEPFDLTALHVFLNEGAAVLVPGHERPALGEGRRVGVVRAREPGDLHPQLWERHSEGDELLYLLSGTVTLVVEQPAGERTIPLQPGDAFVVPGNTWHRFVRQGACDLLFITPSNGTDVRKV